MAHKTFELDDATVGLLDRLGGKDGDAPYPSKSAALREAVKLLYASHYERSAASDALLQRARGLARELMELIDDEQERRAPQGDGEG